MWLLNNNKWVRSIETLSKVNYDSLKQDLSKTRLYSKCLSGSLYSSLIDLNYAYYPNKYKDDSTWYVDFSNSTYINNIQPTLNPTSIDIDKYNKYLIEYGFTTKSHFTPTNLINEEMINFKYVDLCTHGTSDILLSVNTDVEYKDLYIDGIKVINGHRVLIDNQITFITLSSSIDPNVYFDGNYYIVEQDIINTKYYFYNNKNGVYVYRNGYLYRDDTELLDYNIIDSVSYYVKLGTNKDKQFKLYRKRDGYYPIYDTEQYIEFYQFENKILRSKLDYNNVYDINYNDVLYEESHFVDGVFVPERIISIGEFGFINLTQNNKSNFIKNKFRYNLNNISSNSSNYYICADQGVVLLVDKVTLNINRQNINTKVNLNSILFYDNLNGFVVGDFNTIYYTDNGGVTWNQIHNNYFNGKNFNNIVYYNINKVYISGNDGILIECYRDINEWKLISKKISKVVDKDEIIDLKYKINESIVVTSDNTQWNILPSGMSSYDYLIMVCDESNIIIHPLNFKLEFDFYYLDISDNLGSVLNIKIEDSYNIIVNTTNSGIVKVNIRDFVFDTSTIRSNILKSNINSINIIMNNYYNNIDFYGHNIYCVGNSSKNVYIKYDVIPYVESYIDESLYDNIVPKLLFLDYDVASKLNFFDDFGNYILPNDIKFQIDLNNIPSNYKLDIVGDTNYTSWLDYFKDSISTYKYYTDISDTNKVLFSTKFTKSNNYINILNPTINTDINYILPCAPTINDYEKSRYIKKTSDPVIVQTINNSFEVLLYSYLMVIKVPITNTDSIGDCVYIESDVISSYFIINNILTISRSRYKYIYVYTDFNDTIINNIRISNNLKIINLNKFDDIVDLKYKFNLHPISYGYKLNYEIHDSNLCDVIISPKFNNYTAYYNMIVNITDDYDTYTSSYVSSYIKFGYNPMYNIYDYLNNINPTIFNQNKVITAIPSYLNLPCSNSNNSLDSNLYIDTGVDTNKIYFGSDFKYEFDTLQINIFYDIKLNTNVGIKISRQMLLINKSYDSHNNKYIVEFLDKINYGISSSISVSKVSILGRNSLIEISYDLNYVNNISRSISSKKIDNLYTISGYFNNNYKFNTDSYAKILLTDGDIKTNINLIIYSDFNNKLSTNFINFDNTEIIEFVNITSYDVSSNITPDLRIRVNLSNKHNLISGNIIYMSIDSGSDVISGNHIVYDIIDSFSIILESVFDISYLNNTSGTIRFERMDIFSSIQPVDIYDVSNEYISKRAIKVDDTSYDFINYNLSITNIDKFKYRYELVDGLDLISINEKYSWLFESDIDNAIIGEDSNGLVWYTGEWSCGRFFGGTWYSGIWYSGDWYDGTWNSVDVKNNLYNIEVSKNYRSDKSIWYNGRFFGGTWNGGTWYNGRLYDVNWNDGTWYNGTWNGGTWNGGEFTGGVWIYGTWNGGIFNQNNRPAYWVNGTWNDGYFENGRWLNGVFDMKNMSVFGQKSSISSPCIWDSGVFKNGYLLANDDPRSTIWKTGIWLNGTWSGGLSFNIDFKKGVWKNGVSDDIEIISVDLNGDNNSILLNGIFRFNVNDEITIVNDYDDPSIYSTSTDIYDFRKIGSLYYPGKYKVIDVDIIDDKYTKIYVLGLLINGDPNAISNIFDIYDDFRYKEFKDSLNTIPNKRMDIKLVSVFNNCDWYSGAWYNGVFESGNFYGGIWYSGKFSGNWG